MEGQVKNEIKKDYVVYDYSGIFKRFIGKVIDIIFLFLLSKFFILKGVANNTAILFIIFEYLYSILFIYFFGQTVGMWIVGAKVISTTNKRITFGRAVLRAVIGKFSDYIFWLGNVWMMFNDSYQTWQDKLAGTIVVNKSSAQNIEQFILKKPWTQNKHITLIRIAVVTLSICTITPVILYQLVNNFGRFGIIKLHSYKIENKIIAENAAAMASGQYGYTTLWTSNGALKINEYKIDNQGVTVSKTFSIDGINYDEHQLSVVYDINDLDGDGKKELILSRIYSLGEKEISELQIFKLEDSYYKPSSKITSTTNISEAVQNDIIVINAESGNTKKILWCSNQDISLVSLESNVLHQEKKSILPTSNIALVKGSFDGSGKSNVYAVQESRNNMQISIVDIDNNLNLKSYGEINDELSYMEKLYERHIIAGDINNDNKDEFIFTDIEDEDVNNNSINGKGDSWLNAYSLAEGKWTKVLSGGKIPGSNRDKCEIIGDIDNDGKNEIISRSGNEISIYRSRSLFYKLNTFYQELNSLVHSFKLLDE